MKHGLLLINLGTPDYPNIAAVRKYLREFLADKRVIELPTLWRYLLLYCFILPLRPRRSAHAYQAIWTKEGSPLLVNSRNLVAKLQSKMGNETKVALGMCYGQPSIDFALEELKECEKITVLPLYPQYSSAATGAGIEKVLQSVSKRENIPKLNIINHFYSHPAFIKAQAAIIKPALEDSEYLLLSYHGVPERQLLKNECKNQCTLVCSKHSSSFASCYRAQSLQTTELLATELNLHPKQLSSAFQSRLGLAEWIKPYTDKTLIHLAEKGIKKLTIAFPSFVADCLETLEEIGIRARKQWESLGGISLTLAPCLNDSDLWVEAIIEIIQ